MPFQSEKQRRYLWANEPEIARDWTDTYGSRIRRDNGGIMGWADQGGMKNYMGEQPMVNAPQFWRSGPDSSPTELAYITEPEKELILRSNMHGSLGQGPNEGPSGIMSLDSQGDYTRDRSPGAESHSSGGDYEGEQIANEQAARQKAVLTGKIQRDYNTGNWEAGSNLGRRDSLVGLGLGQGNIGIGRSIRGDLGGRRSGISGLLGGLGRGVMSFFGGIPGKIASGFMTAKDWTAKKGQNLGQGVKTFADYPTLDRWMNRNTDKYLNKPYRGQGQGYNFKDPEQGNNFGLYTNRLNEPIGPGKRVGQDQGYYGLGSRYDKQGIAGTDASMDFGKARRLMTQSSRIPGANPLLKADPYQQTYLRNPNETFTLGSSKYASPKRSAKDFIDLDKSYSEFDKIPVDKYHGLNVQRNYLGEPIGSDLVQEAGLLDFFTGGDKEEEVDVNIYGKPETITHGGKTYEMPSRVFPSKGTQNLQGDALKDYIEKNEAMKNLIRNNPTLLDQKWLVGEDL